MRREILGNSDLRGCLERSLERYILHSLFQCLSVAKAVGSLHCLALGNEVGEHLDGVERTPSAFGMELDAPNLLARCVSRLDALDRRVVAVDEERFPVFRERIL